MKIRFTFIVAVTLISLVSFAQEKGLPYFTEVRIPNDFGEPRIASITQSKDGTMVFGSSAGVLSFNGSEWTVTTASSMPLCAQSYAEGATIFAQQKGLSVLAKHDSGKLVLTPFLTSIFENETVLQVLSFQDRTLALTPNKAVLFSEKDRTVTKSITANNNPFSGVFIHQNSIFISDEIGNVFKWVDETLLAQPQFSLGNNVRIVFQFESNGKTVLGTTRNRIHIIKNAKLNTVKGELAKFCSDNIISDGIVINDSAFAISSLAGGAAIVDLETTEITQRLSFGTGFPDNEILALGVDNSNGLWIAYESGLGRSDLGQPVTTLSGFPGLQGKLISTIVYNGQLYVATGNGLYSLTTTTDRKEVEKIIKMERSGHSGPDLNLIPVLSALNGTRNNTAANPARPGALSGSKNGQSTIMPPGANIPGMGNRSKNKAEKIKKPPKKTTTKGKVEKRTLYRKVNGIDAKCRKLFILDSRLFAVSNKGIFLVKNGTAKLVSNKEYVLDAVASSNGNIIYSSTNGIFRLRKNGSKWVTERLKINEDLVTFSLLEHDGYLWAGSENSVKQIAADGSVKTISIPAIGNERVKVVMLFGKPHFLAPSGVYHYVTAQDTVMKASLPSVQNANRYRYILNGKNELWIKDKLGWHVINNDKCIALLPYLGLFHSVSDLISDDTGNLYVIDDGKEIHRISYPRENALNLNFEVSVNKAVTEGGYLFEVGQLFLEPESKSVSFGLSAPYYLQSKSTQFQYRIDGLRDTWSKWNSASVVEIPFLKPGKYQLQVRARNVLGQVSNTTHLSFELQKPVWTRWYMIMVYTIAAILLVLLIIRLRVKSLRLAQQKLQQMVEHRTAELEEEKTKVEDLLLNILPKETALELQEKGRATPKKYNSTSVLFTDFKDFTKFTANAKAEDLISELDRYFIQFDRICDKYGLEKIKTIGDSYMCAGGIPTSNNYHALACTLAALEMAEHMREVAESKKAQGLTPWEIRIGINTGPLLAGVVGEKKFAYDIWGDTVNIASRMETTSESGKVNLSLATYGLVRQYVSCTSRGRIEAKGKGELDMYFANRIKEEYAEKGKPNSRLMKLLGK